MRNGTQPFSSIKGVRFKHEKKKPITKKSFELDNSDHCITGVGKSTIIQDTNLYYYIGKNLFLGDQLRPAGDRIT